MAELGRKKYIDIVAGFMILWMAFDHCEYITSYRLPYLSTLHKCMGFYMPWFFYKSGMFFKPHDSKELFRKDISKHLRCFLIYSIIGWVIWCVCGYLDHSLHSRDFIVIPVKTFLFKGSIKGNGVLWFLLSLFFVRQIANAIIKNTPTHIKTFTAAVISLLIAYLLYRFGWYNYSWWFGNVFTGLFFFLIGYGLKRQEGVEIVFISSLLVFIMVIVAFIMGWISDIPYLYMYANKMISGNYLLFFPFSLACIIVTNNLFCKYEELLLRLGLIKKLFKNG